MEALDNWDVVLLVVAGYVALMALVRLMLHRRNAMLQELRDQISKEKAQKELPQRARSRRSA